jgi:hypothetical protein
VTIHCCSNRYHHPETDIWDHKSSPYSPDLALWDFCFMRYVPAGTSWIITCPLRRRVSSPNPSSVENVCVAVCIRVSSSIAPRSAAILSLGCKSGAWCN